jgi:hypothetical protein
VQLVRSHNFGHTTGDFLLLHAHEWDALWGLPAWATRLFLCLVAFGDFKAGTVRTSYGELLNALQPDQPERGKRLASVTLQQLRDMLRTFEKLLILGRDKARNEEQQALFFQVAPRTQKVAPAEKLNREQNRARKAKQPDLTGQTQTGTPEQNTEENRSSKKNFYNSPTPQTGELSTDGEPERGEHQAPPGGQEVAPSAHAPGASAGAGEPITDPKAVAGLVGAIKARLRGKKTDPQGGRAGPQGIRGATGPPDGPPG